MAFILCYNSQIYIESRVKACNPESTYFKRKCFDMFMKDKQGEIDFCVLMDPLKAKGEGFLAGQCYRGKKKTSPWNYHRYISEF